MKNLTVVKTVGKYTYLVATNENGQVETFGHIVAFNYNEDTQTWEQGHYLESEVQALNLMIEKIA